MISKFFRVKFLRIKVYSVNGFYKVHCILICFPVYNNCTLKTACYKSTRRYYKLKNYLSASMYSCKNISFELRSFWSSPKNRKLKKLRYAISRIHFYRKLSVSKYHQAICYFSLDMNLENIIVIAVCVFSKCIYFIPLQSK